MAEKGLRRPAFAVDGPGTRTSTVPDPILSQPPRSNKSDEQAGLSKQDSFKFVPHSHSIFKESLCHPACPFTSWLCCLLCLLLGTWYFTRSPVPARLFCWIGVSRHIPLIAYRHSDRPHNDHSRTSPPQETDISQLYNQLSGVYTRSDVGLGVEHRLGLIACDRRADTRFHLTLHSPSSSYPLHPPR